LKLDWDDDHDTAEEEEEVEEPPKPTNPKLVTQKSVSKRMLSKEESDALQDEPEAEENVNNPQTMISSELKLASCLKLMSEELVHMVGQIEGTDLRLHLYAWLEKQVPTLKELCRYTSDDDDLTQEEWSIRERFDSIQVCFRFHFKCYSLEQFNIFCCRCDLFCVFCF